MRKPRVAIVGAGIAGLATALGLERAGAEPEIFEQAPVLRASGGALLIWSNGMRALGALGLQQRVADVATPVKLTHFRTARGGTIWTMPVGELSRAAGAPTVVVRRADLLGVLHAEAARLPFRFGQRLLGISLETDGVSLRFDDGRTERFDGVVGADGLHSVVRGHLLGEAPPRRTGHVAWVGISSCSTSLLPMGETNATTGDGLRFCAASLAGGGVFWYATVHVAEPIRTPAQLAERFHHFHAPVEEVIVGTSESDVVRTEIRDRPPAPSWGSGRATLAGDAAHPSTPDLGQGACQALESAVVLSECVARDSIPGAFARYQERRLDRTAKITNFSWLTAKQSMARNRLFGALRAIGMRTVFPSVATTEMKWILCGHGIAARDDAVAR